MSLVIERHGLLATLQDAGRFGVRHLGVGQGGGADWISQRWANWLLGNAPDAAVIEITLGGFSLVAEQDVCLALCGADLDAHLDDTPLAPWRSFVIRKGQRLSLNQARLGLRAYLAAPGGFQAPAVMGSCATVVREGLGGLHRDGRPLAEGERLSWRGTSPAPREVPAERIPALDSRAPLAVVLGAQIGDFAGQSLFDAFNSDWTVDNRADRMGVRLLGPRLECRSRDMVSEGIPLGAIQVPADGQPIVLLNDRQTIGGYPRLGALTPLAVARLAQCPPGSVLRLSPVGLEAAQRQQRQLLALWQHGHETSTEQARRTA
ncbi:biotin-dependent carboxyltransferase family protein [Pseudomonas sp. GCM10022188]|uniref:5-oxoprolinase subunit C family protein n=1 Tax=Pseudomonas TaxID=286 RepID=UPI001E62E929|nr:biotin-dependent carboxyltransferase family protein [Pseudomonas oryzagri]MCC6077090.1 biotin-dependent carboxyltransferase family protein [Pseudomonas oryzagri]